MNAEFRNTLLNFMEDSSFTDAWNEAKNEIPFPDIKPGWISASYRLLAEDEELRQKYIDKHHGGDEASFIAEYNSFASNSAFVSRANKGHIENADWDTTANTFKDYYTNYVEESQADIAGSIFGSDATISSDMSYEEKMAKRSDLLKSVLGSEIADIGGSEEDIVTLAEFAEYNPLTPQEKELEQEGGKLTPLKDRRQELKKLTTGQTKEKTGVEARQMLKQIGNGPISGIKTATGTSEGSSTMQSTFKRLAEKASAQNAMQERVSQYIDKQDATSKLSKLISGELGYDIKRESALKSSRAKAAVGLAGAQLTAQEHAAQLAKGAQF